MSKQEKNIPQALEAEQEVLGGCLSNPDALDKVVAILKPGQFYKPAHRDIYTAMVFLFQKSLPVDITSVSQRLKDTDKLERIGGRSYINDLALGVISTANIEYHAKLVADKAVLRDIISAGSELIQMGFEISDADAAIDAVEELVYKTCERPGVENCQPLIDAMMACYGLMEDRYKNQGQPSGLPSGFYDLDDLTSGFQRSDLIIIAARPSMGKTALCLNIAAHIAKDLNEGVAIFSLEMSREQLVTRLLCSEARIDSKKARTGQFEPKDWTNLTEAMQVFTDVPIWIDDSPNLTVMDVRAKCRRMASGKNKLGLVVIDYLQLMQDGKGQNRRVEEISAISRGLKNLARELNVPIIALSQLSRALESRENKVPRLSDLRESGSIEQDADVVMFIYRHEVYEPEDTDARGKAEIHIAKQRNGPTGKACLNWSGQETRFTNPTRTKTVVYGGGKS
jgi:replicative DNA helicase